MPAAGVVMLVAVLAIVLALVYYLVSTIVALRQITAGLDDAIAGVGEIVEKSARNTRSDVSSEMRMCAEDTARGRTQTCLVILTFPGYRAGEGSRSPGRRSSRSRSSPRSWSP